MCGRALKTEALLNDSIGAGYIDRHWPRAFEASGAWPLGSLRQSFLSGTLTLLNEPDTVLRRNILEFFERGDFGLVSGQRPMGATSRPGMQSLPTPTSWRLIPACFCLPSEKRKKSKMVRRYRIELQPSLGLRPWRPSPNLNRSPHRPLQPGETADFRSYTAGDLQPI